MSDWKCPTCSYDNDSSFSTCATCEYVKPVPTNQKWSCVMCTLENEASSQACMICMAPNPLITNLSGKVICPHCVSVNDSNVQKCVMCTLNIRSENSSSFGFESSVNDPHSNKYQSQYRSDYTDPSVFNQQPSSEDTSEILTYEENGLGPIGNKEAQVAELEQMYRHAYFTMKKLAGEKQDERKIAAIVKRAHRYMSEDHHQDEKKSDEDRSESKSCTVCFGDFDEEVERVQINDCAHNSICSTCFPHWLSTKIRDDAITPWLLCPEPDCKTPIHPRLLMQFLKPEQLYKFASSFLRKHLAPNPNWIECKKCQFGFIMLCSENEAEKTVNCDACQTRQKISSAPLDEYFQDMIISGEMRLCPRCGQHTMKDKGMCNSMKCHGCGIFWNWSTRETATTNDAIKKLARRNGTLWERGELAYQRELEHSDPEAFRKLLERNGIEHNPRHRRGRD